MYLVLTYKKLYRIILIFLSDLGCKIYAFIQKVALQPVSNPMLKQILDQNCQEVRKLR